jgi:MFS family permease
MSAPALQARSGLLAPALPSPPTSIPWLGLVAVLIGAFISTLNGRLSTFGLADIRGAVGAGFDEGAWITTAQTTAQMFVTLIAVWMGAAYGPRRVLIWASLFFAVISLLIPYSATLSMLLTLQFVGGLASGFFIPLTLGFILLNVPPRYWAFGIAIYALNLELSLNISASLEGYYVEHHSWRWIFWQNVPLALLMSLCLRQGIAIKPNLIGLHVQIGDAQVIQRMRTYGAVTTRADPSGAADRGVRVLDNAVRAAATTQAVMDCFVAVAILTAVALLIVVFRSAAPEGPASPLPLFRVPGRKPQ